MDKEGLTWDKASKENIITLVSVDALLYTCKLCLVKCCTCSRHLLLFFSLSMPDKCARNLVSSLLVKLGVWYMPGDTEKDCQWEWFFQGGHKQRGTVETQLLYFFGHKAHSVIRRNPNFSTRFF